jgi:hypothetical protein
VGEGEGEGDEVMARWMSRTTRAPDFFGICYRKRIARSPSGALVRVQSSPERRRDQMHSLGPPPPE